MITLKGKGVCGGIAIGRLSFYRRGERAVRRCRVEDTEAELARVRAAGQTAKEELRRLCDRAAAEVGEANAMIFEVHQMMLEDPDYQESIANIIRTQGVNAEYAVEMTGDNFSRMFAAMEDEYFRARAADVRDISERLVRILTASQEGEVASEEPVIVASGDLAPSETVQLDKSRVLAFVTARGSANSHTAIIARTLNIPAIVDIGGELAEEYRDQMAVADGFSGTLYIDPDEETLARMTRKRDEDLSEKALLQEQKGRETVTLDGRRVELYANIGSAAEVGTALQNDAGGIGLFRSEFLYLENGDYPTEEQQFLVYKTAAENMAGKKVIIRTLDIGADKQIEYFHLPKEENPALGYRAIRICLTRPEVFKTQLRALLRASAFGRLAVMFPMITSVQEVRRIKEIVEEVKEELRASAVPFDEHVELGIMIETPAAVMISDLLAKEVDFFSVGTNDLTQYTLAVDRQNPKLDEFYDAHHPAVLRMLELVAKNAHAEGIWVGICGELAADMELTEVFLKMGIDELSVSPAFILPLRRKIRETDVSRLQKIGGERRLLFTERT